MHMMAWAVIGSERKEMESGRGYGLGHRKRGKGEYPSWAEQKKQQQEGRKDESEEAQRGETRKATNFTLPHFLCAVLHSLQ